MNQLKNYFSDILSNEAQRLFNKKVQLQKKLTELQSNSNSPEMSSTLKTYQQLTGHQLKILEQIIYFGLCKHINPENNLEKITKLINRIEARYAGSDAELREAILIVTLQSINQYDISSYKRIHAFAQALKMENVTNKIHHCLQDEIKMEKQLSHHLNHKSWLWSEEWNNLHEQSKVKKMAAI